MCLWNTVPPNHTFVTSKETIKNEFKILFINKFFLWNKFLSRNCVCEIRCPPTILLSKRVVHFFNDGRQVICVLLAHPWTFGSSELTMYFFRYLIVLTRKALQPFKILCTIITPFGAFEILCIWKYGKWSIFSFVAIAPFSIIFSKVLKLTKKNSRFFFNVV